MGGGTRITLARGFFLRRRAVLVLLAIGFGLTSQSCQRKSAEQAGTKEAKDNTSQTTRAVSSQDVFAAWYDVPADSLARRRAGAEELTAAHNRLPLGTLVRVTHLANGKSVTVRITDRGITKKKIKLDLSKEAAVELGMVGEGIARVRMEVMPNETAPGP